MRIHEDYRIVPSISEWQLSETDLSCQYLLEVLGVLYTLALQEVLVGQFQMLLYLLMKWVWHHYITDYSDNSLLPKGEKSCRDELKTVFWSFWIPSNLRYSIIHLKERATWKNPKHLQLEVPGSPGGPGNPTEPGLPVIPGSPGGPTIHKPACPFSPFVPFVPGNPGGPLRPGLDTPNQRGKNTKTGLKKKWHFKAK